MLLALVAFAVGVLLGPWVFDSADAQEEQAAPSPPPATDPGPPQVTYSTREPSVATEPRPSPSIDEADLLAGVRGRQVPATGSGALRVVPGTAAAPEGSAPITTVRVEVEPGLDIDDQRFAAFVMDTLNDDRGWGGDGSVRFSRTAGDADLRVVLATPGTVDDMCAPLATNGRWSCGRYGHAALNAERWITGAEAFLDAGGDLTEYRQYLVNHEVGHLLGHPHARCPAPGSRAPVMLQQSISLGGCDPNGWPRPSGTAGPRP